MNKVTQIFSSKLVAAEASFNSAFGVISKIQEAAVDAENAAYKEADKAALKRIEYQTKEDELKIKSAFYGRRADKIARFIANLDD